MNSVRLSRAMALPLVSALVLTLTGCGALGGGKDTAKTPTIGNRVSVLSRVEAGAKVDPALASVAVILPPAQVNADWPQAGGTPSKSYGHLALSSMPTKTWSASVSGGNARRRLAAAPVVGEGMLFAVGVDGTVTAFDAGTGARRWSKSFDADSNSNALFGGGVSYDGGRVYVTSGLGDVAALNAKDGTEIWKKKPAGPLRGAPTVAFDSVYVMTQNNNIIALNSSDGEIHWSESASLGQAGVFGVGAPAAAQGTVIAGFSTGELVAYRYENGRVLWSDALARTSLSTSVSVLTDVDADPIIDRGRVYALGQGGRMAAYDLLSGQRVWELNVAGISTPAIAGDWIFTLTDDSQLLAIARNTGKVRWSTQLKRFRNEEKRQNSVFWTGPVLAGDNLWAASSEGHVVALSVMDGSVREFTKLGDSVSLAPLVANGTLYIMDDGGQITAFR